METFVLRYSGGKPSVVLGILVTMTMGESSQLGIHTVQGSDKWCGFYSPAGAAIDRLLLEAAISGHGHPWVDPELWKILPRKITHIQKLMRDGYSCTQYADCDPCLSFNNPPAVDQSAFLGV